MKALSTQPGNLIPAERGSTSCTAVKAWCGMDAAPRTDSLPIQLNGSGETNNQNTKLTATWGETKALVLCPATLMCTPAMMPTLPLMLYSTAGAME